MNVNNVAVPKVFPCFWQALLVLFASFIVLVSLGIGIGILDAIAKMLKNEVLISVFSFLNSLINLVLIPIALGIFYFTKAPIKEIFSFKTTKVIFLLPLVVLLLGSSAIESEMDNIVRYLLPMPEFIKEIMMGLIQNKWLSFILLVIVASLTEELLFRGVILRGFLTHYKKLTAITVSAILFSLFHINIYQFFSAFILGLILGWVYAETRSLYLCFFIHSFHNLLCWLCAFNVINIHIPGYTFSGEVDYNLTEFQPLWFNVTGVILFLIGLLLMKKLFQSQSQEMVTELPMENTNDDTPGLSGKSEKQVEQGTV